MLELRQISFAYQHRMVVDHISLTVPKGQHLALIGESGCGKSTLLKLMYGLYDLNEGEISYEGKPIFGPRFNLIPGMDFMKYLAQDFDLMPFITVEENIGKYLSNIYKDRKKQRVAELLDMVEMTEFAQTKAQYLSGGQQQRVALARVLALEPEVLLLDEPFSQIDAFRRNKLRRNLFRYLKERQISCIFATHDATDILAFADETLVMRSGKIHRKGNPKAIYENPDDYYTASLFEEVNEIPSKFITGAETATVLCYPHQLKVVGQSKLKATVVKSFFTGNGFLIEATYEKGRLFFENPIGITSGTGVFLEYSKMLHL
ncbi:ABC transporter ATP-binding protein [Flavobacterium sp.]|uniref:ABC transporter ATP-binding protein n=1 Tax=Flavobacterium sp. TaxID=239 RepID=UPI0039E32278